MKNQDNKHCVRCGEPTSARFCVECERDERADFERMIAEGGEW